MSFLAQIANGATAPPAAAAAASAPAAAPATQVAQQAAPAPTKAAVAHRMPIAVPGNIRFNGKQFKDSVPNVRFMLDSKKARKMTEAPLRLHGHGNTALQRLDEYSDQGKTVAAIAAECGTSLAVAGKGAAVATVSAREAFRGNAAERARATA